MNLFSQLDEKTPWFVYIAYTWITTAEVERFHHITHMDCLLLIAFIGNYIYCQQKFSLINNKSRYHFVSTATTNAWRRYK